MWGSRPFVFKFRAETASLNLRVLVCLVLLGVVCEDSGDGMIALLALLPSGSSPEDFCALRA